MFQVELPRYLGLNSGRSVSINVNKTKKHCSRNIDAVRMFPHCFLVSHTGNIVSSVSFCFKMQIMLTLHGKEFYQKSEHASTYGKILRARASEYSSYFCEQFEQRPNFASTFKLDGTIRYPFNGSLKAQLYLCSHPPCPKVVVLRKCFLLQDEKESKDKETKQKEVKSSPYGQWTTVQTFEPPPEP